VTWKTPVTLLILLVLLLGGAFYGWQTIISPATKEGPAATGDGQPTDKCDQVQQFHRGQLIRADDIVVNVYNAGSIANLAEDTLRDLKKQGFKSGVFDNAPTRVTASNVTILTQGKVTPQVRLVATQFKGDVRYAKGAPIDTGIDVIVGDKFQGVDKDAKKTLRLKRDISTCTDVETAAG
jgi:hypothetical protein